MAPRKSPFDDPWKPPKPPKRSSGTGRLPTTVPTVLRMPTRLPRPPRPGGPPSVSPRFEAATHPAEDAAAVRSSKVFRTIARAIDERSVVRATYDAEDRARVLCPARIGIKSGVHYVEAFQVGGYSKSELPAEGHWRCFRLMGLGNVATVDGEWRLGDRESVSTRCFGDVVYPPTGGDAG